MIPWSSGTATAIHIAPDDSFNDWVVRDENGAELGHYPTREEAEIVGETRARKRGDELVIHLPDGRTIRKLDRDARQLREQNEQEKTAR